MKKKSSYDWTKTRGAPNTQIRQRFQLPGPALVKGIPQDLGAFFQAEPWDAERFLDVKRLSPAIHGEVRLAVDTLYNEKVVVKVIRNAAVRARRRGELENPLVEIGAMSYIFSNKARCPPQFIAKLKGVYEDADFTYMVTEYCVGGELFKEVVARKYFFERGVKAIALQLCFALLSLHTNGLAHRDVSLENTLLQADRTVCLIDFGQADVIFDEFGAPRQLTGTAGKSYYRAPEMSSQGSYFGPPADVFALGVQIFIMVCGSPPWQEAVPKDERFSAMTKSPAAFEECLLRWNRRDRMSYALVDLLSWIFASKPSQRPTIEEMFLHPWFSFDAGVWRWVYKHAPSGMIRDQISKVETYLIDHPEGKYFIKAPHAAPVIPPKSAPSTVIKTVPSKTSRDIRQEPEQSSSKVKTNRTSKLQQVLNRHFRPEH